MKTKCHNQLFYCEESNKLYHQYEEALNRVNPEVIDSRETSPVPTSTVNQPRGLDTGDETIFLYQMRMPVTPMLNSPNADENRADASSRERYFKRQIERLKIY